MVPRFELHENWQRLAAWAGVPASSFPSNRPTEEVPGRGRKLHPVLRISAATGERELVWMREGLIPSYACDDRGAEQRSEAHAEAMTCDSCFRSAFRRRRCLIPADILNERRHLSTGIEHPCSFALESGGIFGIAGVWETWTNDEGHAVESFAMITAMVTPVLRTLFDRMPIVLIDAKDQNRWLHSAKKDQPPLDLLRPMSTSELRDWTMMPGPIDMHLPQVAMSGAHQQ